MILTKHFLYLKFIVILGKILKKKNQNYSLVFEEFTRWGYTRTWQAAVQTDNLKDLSPPRRLKKTKARVLCIPQALYVQPPDSSHVNRPAPKPRGCQALTGGNVEGGDWLTCDRYLSNSN